PFWPGREYEVTRVPQVEGPPGVDDYLLPRRGADRPSRLGIDRAEESAEEERVVVKLDGAMRQGVLDLVREPVLRLDRVRLPDDEVPDWIGGRFGPPEERIPEGHPEDAIGPRRRVAVAPLGLGDEPDDPGRRLHQSLGDGHDLTCIGQREVGGGDEQGRD